MPYDDRETPRECPECQEPAQYVLVRRAIQQGTERKHGDKRIIWDERQVASDKGKHWRDEGTTGREGGIGRKTFFT